MGSHSSTTEVWVAFRQRRAGGKGERWPYVVKISSCNLANASRDAFSELRFRDTLMSTIEPEDILGGKRIEGNSIC